MPEGRNFSTLDLESLRMHAAGRPGKIEVVPTKPLTTQYHLSLAYSPGVAAPCLEIFDDPDKAYDYTSKGNLVAVISNGTAVLGLGDLGALGSKPVMEGKAVLFKRFADVDGIDLEVDTRDVDEFVNCVRFLGKSWGGINLEDIKAPECFIIEQRLRELMDIPVFHDDQHGTAIIAAAGLLNALELTGRSIKNMRMVINGAGASAIACVELFKGMGLPSNHVILCDSKGVVYEGRKDGMNQWKSAHAVDTPTRTLAEAMKGCDVFVGLSVKGAVTKEMVRSMADKPIIFALANPDPEITPEDVASVRDDAIVATGRSDYPNQVNNVLGFPFIFRGALDVRASQINDEMKIAAAHALAKLAREDVPDEVSASYSGRRLQFGPDYVIPGAVRPAPDRRDSERRRRGRDADRGRAQADRRHGGVSLDARHEARSDGRQPSAAVRRRQGKAEAGRVRRRRGGARDPGRAELSRRWPWDSGPDRPRGDDCRDAREHGAGAVGAPRDP